MRREPRRVWQEVRLSLFGEYVAPRTDIASVNAAVGSDAIVTGEYERSHLRTSCGPAAA
jgi:hypothetical protein